MEALVILERLKLPWDDRTDTNFAYSKLQMFGGKTCHACTQLEHVFSSHAHA